MPRSPKLFLCAFAVLTSTIAAIAQQPTQPPAANFALDVVSIKPNNSGSRNFGGSMLPTGGLRIINMPLSDVVFMAYFDYFRGSQVLGAPAWAQNEHFDFVGRLDDASAAAWQKLTISQRQQPTKLILQKLLADRCKLVAHLVPTQADGYALVLGRHSSRLTPTTPGEAYPDGVKNIDAGGKVLTSTEPGSRIVTMRLFNVSVPFLAYFIGARSGSLIEDQTSLTDRYDFTLRQLEIPKDSDGKPTIANPQPADLWDLSALGLELKHAKVTSQNLVIDHIERPTAN